MCTINASVNTSTDGTSVITCPPYKTNTGEKTTSSAAIVEANSDALKSRASTHTAMTASGACATTTYLNSKYAFSGCSLKRLRPATKSKWLLKMNRLRPSAIDDG